MTMDDELALVPELTNLGRALVDFIASLAQGQFQRRGQGQWVYSQNFVAFKIQHAKKCTIRMSLYGNWLNHHLQHTDTSSSDGNLKLYSSRGSYVEGEIKSPRQLAVAAAHIERAFRLYKNRRR
jgi:hypothetical protein